MAFNRRPPTEYADVFSGRSGKSPTIEPALEVQGDFLLNHNLPNRARGLNQLPRRLELKWVAGTQGLPQLNAVTIPDAANTYVTADFLALLNADRHFEILGTNAVSADVTYAAEGGIDLASHGATNDTTILLPHLTGSASSRSPWSEVTWGSDQQTAWECHIKTGASVANYLAWAGLKLTNTSTVATDNDQVFFRFATASSDTNWQCVYSIGNVDVTVDSGVAVVASTEYHLKATIDDARVARFYISSGTNAPVLAATSGALTDATDFIPYIAVGGASAAVKHLVVYSQAISRAYA
jgi:hypothetical protein